MAKRVTSVIGGSGRLHSDNVSAADLDARVALSNRSLEPRSESPLSYPGASYRSPLAILELGSCVSRSRKRTVKSF